MNHDQQVSRPMSNYDADEIDLFELLQMLWQEKILIILTILIFTCVAAFYAFTAQPQYSVSMTLKPGPLSLYGELVAGMDSKEQKSIALGRSTAEQVLAELNNNLALRTNQASHLNDESTLGFKVTSQGRQQITLELSILQPEGAATKLQNYLEAVSKITVKELNSFVHGLGNTNAITKKMLYTVDASSSQASLVKPKKSLIIAVGFVMGGMLGVFAVLIRSMIRKRKNANAQ